MHALAADSCDPEFNRALIEAADTIDRMHAERLKLDRRIHNQRRANRETWEIVEMRRKWLGSDTARKAYNDLLKRHRELIAAYGQSAAPIQSDAPKSGKVDGSG